MGQPNQEDKVRLRACASEVVSTESARAMLWFPVGIGVGIWIYFAVPNEPPAWTAAVVLLPLALTVTSTIRRLGTVAHSLTVAAFAVTLGYGSALIHAHAASAPVLSQMQEAGVEGRVVEVGKSASGAPRVLLDQVRVYGLEQNQTPDRLRISLTDVLAKTVLPVPGDRIRVYARIFPPGGAVEPGAFDFQRRAFFERIGGVGYALGPFLRIPQVGALPLSDRFLIALAKLRGEISQGLRETLPGPDGAFAAAIIVGDRSGIEDAEEEALRAANLSHLLAISGLHMGILCGLIFVVVRSGAALVPMIALRYPVKKIAAVAAILAGFGYLMLSGITVPTQRAFAMVAVALVAVILDRPAITLRALAVAATIILLNRPISLFDAGFQMSFAATVALVAAFEVIRIETPGRGHRISKRVLLYMAGIAATSVIAGLATGPFAAFHFNRVAVWGLPANLMALPIMGMWIAPLAVVSGVLAPLELSDWALTLMGTGIGAILKIAAMVAGWPGATFPLQQWSGTALALISLGGLWLALWRSRLRYVAIVPILIGLWAMGNPPSRPTVLLAPGARLVGVLGEDGRALDQRRAQSFAAETWLRRDGDDADQAMAAGRPALQHGRSWARANLENGWTLEVLHGRAANRTDLQKLCEPQTVLVARHGMEIDGPCCYLGATALAAKGAISIHATDDGLRLTSAYGPGSRLWRPGLPDILNGRCE